MGSRYSLLIRGADTLTSILLDNHNTNLIHHDRRSALDERHLPCVRHTCSLREMIDYRVQVTLWTKGVALRYFLAHRVKGYSLLTKRVANPLESGIFALD
jgi:hypothetical protein